MNGNKFNAVNYDHEGGLDIVYMPLSEQLSNRQGEKQKLFNANKQSSRLVNEEKEKLKESGVIKEDSNSRFKWRPSSLRDFGMIKCKATNEIGSTECTYELKLGGELQS